MTSPAPEHPLKRWSAADIRRARQRELAPLLAAMGHTLQPLEDGNFRLLGEVGNIIVKDNYWIRSDTGEAAPKPRFGTCPDHAGNAVDFFVKIRGLSFIETMRLLLA